MNDVFSQDILAKRFMVIDVDRSEILLSRMPTQQCEIASIQKLLTALLIVDRGNLDERIEIVPEDVLCEDVRAGLHVGENYSRRDLLACMLIGNANDAAEALARDHSGSISAFADAMNARAQILGMTSSVFRVPHGLPCAGQYSTALDVARLAVAVDANEFLRSVISQRHCELRHPDGTVQEFVSANLLLSTLVICDGMATGFTRDAGHCLLASGELDGRRRIAVLLDCSPGRIWQDTHHLLAWSFGETRRTNRCLHSGGNEDLECEESRACEKGFAEEETENASIANPTAEKATKTLDELFSCFSDTYIAPCTAWASAGNLPESGPGTVFYPFGGPDLLFPLALFPHARTFVLVGKEPWGGLSLEGDIPSPGVRESLDHYLRTSFFVTSDMTSDIQRHSLSGVLPLMQAQLSWKGYQIASMEEIGSGDGVRLSVASAQGSAAFTVYYFRQNLLNEYFSPETMLAYHLSNCDGFSVLVKSASYLLHEPDFSKLAEYIVAKASLIVQDPSGIPYKHLCDAGWKTTLHGKFVGDIPLFGERHAQPLLHEAYRHGADARQALGFGFGYLKNPAIAAIMVAKPDGARHL